MGRPFGPDMAFDPGLAQRVRDVLADRRGVDERRMFGGLAFLLDGNMAVGVLGSTLMVRVGAARHAEALATKHVRPMDFTGRPMTGFVFVDEAGIADDASLELWIGRAVDFVRTLPRKQSK